MFVCGRAFHSVAGDAIIVAVTETWRQRATCLGADEHVFFPTGRRFTATTWKEARAFCARCPVTQQCLDVAMRQQLSEDRWGMFGGKTPTERRMMREVL